MIGGDKEMTHMYAHAWRSYGSREIRSEHQFVNAVEEYEAELAEERGEAPKKPL